MTGMAVGARAWRRRTRPIEACRSSASGTVCNQLLISLTNVCGIGSAGSNETRDSLRRTDSTIGTRQPAEDSLVVERIPVACNAPGVVSASLLTRCHRSGRLPRRSSYRVIVQLSLVIAI